MINTKFILCRRSSWIKINLGINPVKGGKPPKDRRDTDRIRDNLNLDLNKSWEIEDLCE